MFSAGLREEQGSGADAGGVWGNFCMKYAIDTLIAVLPADDKESIDRILYGDPYEVFKESESSEPMEEAEAMEAFSKLYATARRKEDGSIEFRIPTLAYGQEELDEDITRENGEDFYYLSSYEMIDQTEFDEESQKLLRELGF